MFVKVVKKAGVKISAPIMADTLVMPEQTLSLTSALSSFIKSIRIGWILLTVESFPMIFAISHNALATPALKLD